MIVQEDLIKNSKSDKYLKIKLPLKVHLMGGDSTGWALDQDFATTHFALSSLPEIIQLTSLKDADVVHAVWEEPLLALNPALLDGKRILCHACNDIFKTLEHSFMLNSYATIGRWVAISKKAQRDLASLNVDSCYIPYTLDTSHFHQKISIKRIRELQKQYCIPYDTYVIGNFMRDTLGENLQMPKPQKGAEVFISIVKKLHDLGLPIHVLLAGPRRHWLIHHFQKDKIPFSYAGQITTQDDYSLNLLSQDKIGELYHLIDVNLVTSRWEGGPRCVLEGAATRTKVVSPAIGMALDILEPYCLYDAVDSAVEILFRDIKNDFLASTLGVQYDRFVTDFIPSSNIYSFKKLYQHIDEIEPFNSQSQTFFPARQSTFQSFRHRLKKRIKGYCSKNSRTYSVRIGLWHKYFKPPYGGGNQFMMALQKAIQQHGVKVSFNKISPSVDVHICNSAWFDVEKFQKGSAKRPLKIIHRVDGPIALYRESTWDEDNRIYDLNNKWASATVYQSAWCYQKMLALNFQPVRPLIIHNAVDSDIFHKKNRITFNVNRKIRLISTSWSDNPKKGGPFYKALEDKLDWSRFSYTFVGNVQQKFDKIDHLSAQNSQKLAEILRQHDIYVMASESEACSNALLEALACGLPVLYIEDGGNGELVGFGGLPFRNIDQALENLERLVQGYEMFQDGIYVDSITDIARKYLDLAEKLMS
jgi:glycosyltransferase involved in cell wall biosynthesis